MKPLRVLFWLVWLSAAAIAQSTGLKVCETDGSPCKSSIKEIYVSPGTLTISGQRATITTGGGGGGSGDVVGPASATDNAVARFDLTTGKLIQNSVVTIADTSGNMAGVGTLNTHTIPGGTSTFVLQSNNLSVFAATTSAQLRGVLSDESGTGVAYFQGGDIGTPSAGVGTNFTGIPISTALTGAGTGVLTALAVNIGSAGAPVLLNGALGTPSSGTVTNLTGTASININGTVGATTPATGAFTTIAASGAITQTSASATAFESGPNGGTNPVLRIVNSTASQADGVSVTGAAAGSGTTFAALSSGSNSQLIFTPKGTGINQFTGNSNGDLMRMGNNGSYYWNDGGAGPTLTLSGAVGRVVTYTALMTRASKPIYVLNANGMFGWGSWTNFSESADTGMVRAEAGAIRITDGQTSGTANTTAGNLILGNSGGVMGSGAKGVLNFSSSTEPSTSPTDTVQVYSGDAAATDHNLYTRNEAGEITRLTGLAARNSAQFDKTNTTLANVTGLTRNVEAGRTYSFRAVLQTVGDAAGGVKLAISGTATATAISYVGILMDGTSIIANTRATALDTTVCASSTSTAGTCEISGTIQVNAAGTLTVQFAQNNASGISSVLANQLFQLIPIT